VLESTTKNRRRQSTKEGAYRKSRRPASVDLDLQQQRTRLVPVKRDFDLILSRQQRPQRRAIVARIRGSATTVSYTERQTVSRSAILPAKYPLLCVLT